MERRRRAQLKTVYLCIEKRRQGIELSSRIERSKCLEGENPWILRVDLDLVG